MNCTITERMISAYLDKELAAEVRAELIRHLAGCGRCAQTVADFQQLSRLVARLPDPNPPADLWSKIEHALDQPTTDSLVRVVGPFLVSAKAAWHAHPALRFAAVAATVMFLVASGFLLTSFSPHEAEHRQVSAEFERYLNRFHQDAGGAQQILMANYNGRRVSPRDAAALVRYEPVAATHVPMEYAIDDVNVLEMPCCKCVQVIWRQGNGRIAIFEHEMERPEWFGKRPSIVARCHDKAVRIVEMDDLLAATWTSGSRQLTLVGARDINELMQLVLHFDNTS